MYFQYNALTIIIHGLISRLFGTKSAKRKVNKKDTIHVELVKFVVQKKSLFNFRALWNILKG